MASMHETYRPRMPSISTICVGLNGKYSMAQAYSTADLELVCVDVVGVQAAQTLPGLFAHMAHYVGVLLTAVG
jgi:hypothetical protein